MCASIQDEPKVSWRTDVQSTPAPYSGFPRNIGAIDALKFSPSLQPQKYEILGTHPESRILFADVSILDSTGHEPYRGDVLIEGTPCLAQRKVLGLPAPTGERLVQVGVVADRDDLIKDPKVRVFQGRGRTLMSGLGDAHAHFTWNGTRSSVPTASSRLILAQVATSPDLVSLASRNTSCSL